MSLDDNKKLVRDYFELSNKGEIAKATALLAEDFVYTCKGKTPETTAKRTKSELVSAIVRGASFWKVPIKITIHGMTAEADRVAVEADSHGVLSTGAPYDNAYHFLIKVKGGKIASLDEYFCTATFHNVIFAARGSGAGG